LGTSSVDARGRPVTPMDASVDAQGCRLTSMDAQHYFPIYCAFVRISEAVQLAKKCSSAAAVRYSIEKVQKFIFWGTRKCFTFFWCHPLQVQMATVYSFCLAILTQITWISRKNTKGLTGESLLNHGVENRAKRATTLSLID
jgi:hypothetical protein